MISANLKILFFSASLLLLAACELKQPPFELDNDKYAGAIDHKAASPGTLMRKQTNDIYELKYQLARNHRAIVQSTSGAWGWSRNQSSVDAAIDRALEVCRKNNQSHEDSKPCQLVNLNGYWMANYSKKP